MIIVRYAEIALKGNNRMDFENQLIDNLKSFYPGTKVKRVNARILVFTENDEKMKLVFGISSYSNAVECDGTVESIENKLTELCKNMKGKFRVSGSRITKTFPMNSQEIGVTFGSFVNELTGMKVDLKNYDHDIGIEIIHDKALIYLNRTEGLGGLPVGVSGKIDVDDEKSAFLMMKRGCEVTGNVGRAIKFMPYAVNNEKIIAKTNSHVLPNVNEEEGFVLRPLIGLNKSELNEIESYFA